MNTPDGYERVAKQAADRWKQSSTPELKEQILDTWRLAKAHRLDTESGVRPAVLAGIWQAAFKGIGSWDFDFLKDDASL